MIITLCERINDFKYILQFSQVVTLPDFKIGFSFYTTCNPQLQLNCNNILWLFTGISNSRAACHLSLYLQDTHFFRELKPLIRTMCDDFCRQGVLLVCEWVYLMPHLFCLNKYHYYNKLRYAPAASNRPTVYCKRIFKI